MELNYNQICELRRTLDGNNRFLMLLDKSPDGDQLGASYAMGMWLRSRGKQVSWRCLEVIPQNYWLTNFPEEVNDEIKEAQEYDVVIINDCGNLKRTGLLEAKPGFLENSFIINFDHHPSNTLFGNINIIDTQAAATCEIMYFILKEFGVTLDPDMATYLLLGLYADTGCFQHTNTSKQNLAIASSLIQRGANMLKAAKAVRTIPLLALAKWGKILEEVKIHDGVCAIFVTKELIEKYDIAKDELSGMSEILVTVPGVKFSMVITELQDELKGSLRTERNDIDVMKICQDFGGGGHKKAAGFIFSKDDEQLKEKLFGLLGV